VGGNLSVVAALAGTRYLADHRGALAFFEDVNEEPYRLDRMFTQLAQVGPLGQCAGVLLGVFRGCSAKPGEPSLSLAETIFDHFGGLPRPAVYGYAFGHIPFQMTLPMGIHARLDTAASTVTLLESAVR
jgi:muramoyltetrapeptide carboxypeptidase